jgi:hypothetical protein
LRTFECHSIFVDRFSSYLGDVPLPGVLLSLNGENLVRNDYTDEKGELVFTNLFPGGYNVKALLKEYSFNTSPYYDLQEGIFLRF